MRLPEGHVTIRRAQSSDLPFVFSSWLNSYESSGWARGVRRRTYFTRHHAVVSELLSRPSCVVLVAALEEDPDVILAWAALEPVSSTVHYVYVKESWRRLGLARRLLDELPGGVQVYTHRTMGPHGRVERLIRQHLAGASYDPYAAFPPTQTAGDIPALEAS